MIIEQKDQDVHNITESNITESNITEFIAFCKFVSLKNTLLNYCKFKTQGFHVFDIFKVLFFTIFKLRNFWRLSVADNSSIPFARDTALC